MSQHVQVKSEPNVYVSHTKDSLQSSNGVPPGPQTLVARMPGSNSSSTNFETDLESIHSFSDNTDVKTIHGLQPHPVKKARTRVFTKNPDPAHAGSVMDGVTKLNYLNTVDNLKQRQNREYVGDRTGVESRWEEETAMLEEMGEGANDYLIPEDPPLYSDGSQDGPQDRCVPAAGGIGRRPTKAQRFDSGVGDCESLTNSSSPGLCTSPSPCQSAQQARNTMVSNSASSSLSSESNPRMSTHVEQHYEELDEYQKSHQKQQYPKKESYDLLDSSSMSNVYKRPEDKSQEVRQGCQPQADLSSPVQSDPEDNHPLVRISMAQTVSRSWRDPQAGTLPHTYMPFGNSVTHTDDTQQGPGQIGKWLMFILVLAVIISLTSLSLSFYILFSNLNNYPELPPPSSDSEHLLNLNTSIWSLQQTLQDLKEENIALRQLWLTQQNISSQIESELTELSWQHKNLSQTVQVMEARIDADIANIILTPGPQGPEGVANFSLCVSQSISMEAPPSALTPTETIYMPSETEIQNYFVTFAYCTYTGATGAYLETKSSQYNGRQRYRCKCMGQVTGTSVTSCRINLWMCPQKS